MFILLMSRSNLIEENFPTLKLNAYHSKTSLTHPFSHFFVALYLAEDPNLGAILRQYM